MSTLCCLPSSLCTLLFLLLPNSHSFPRKSLLIIQLVLLARNANLLRFLVYNLTSSTTTCKRLLFSLIIAAITAHKCRRTYTVTQRHRLALFGMDLGLFNLRLLLMRVVKRWRTKLVLITSANCLHRTSPNATNHEIIGNSWAFLWFLLQIMLKVHAVCWRMILTGIGRSMLALVYMLVMDLWVWRSGMLSIHIILLVSILLNLDC